MLDYRILYFYFQHGLELSGMSDTGAAGRNLLRVQREQYKCHPGTVRVPSRVRAIAVLALQFLERHAVAACLTLVIVVDIFVIWLLVTLK